MKCVRACVCVDEHMNLSLRLLFLSIFIAEKKKKKKLRDVWLETIFVFFFQSIENRRMKQNTSKNCLLLIFLRTNQIQFEEENEIYRREFFFLFSYSLFSSLPIDIIDWSMKRRRRKKNVREEEKEKVSSCFLLLRNHLGKTEWKKRRVMTHIYRQSLLFLLSLSGFFLYVICVYQRTAFSFSFFLFTHIYVGKITMRSRFWHDEWCNSGMN